MACRHSLGFESLRNGRYTIVDRIGEGATCEVFTAIDTWSRSTVAIKLVKLREHYLPLSKSREITFVEEFKRKEHRNVVRLLDDVFIERQFACIVMERLKSYNTWLNRAFQPSQPHLLKMFLRDVFNALLYFHDHGLIHRDLKPGNLLVDDKITDSPIIKICDFGSARALVAPGDILSPNVGTPGYKAPEILLGLPYGTACDVWSLGTVFLERVTGRRAFTSALVEGQLLEIFRVMGTPTAETWPAGTSAIRFPREIPPQQDAEDLKHMVEGSLDPEGLDLLNKMLMVNPENRITAASALSHSYLSEIFETEPVSSEESSQPQWKRSKTDSGETSACKF